MSSLRIQAEEELAVVPLHHELAPERGSNGSDQAKSPWPGFVLAEKIPQTDGDPLISSWQGMRVSKVISMSSCHRQAEPYVHGTHLPPMTQTCCLMSLDLQIKLR